MQDAQTFQPSPCKTKHQKMPGRPYGSTRMLLPAAAKWETNTWTEARDVHGWLGGSCQLPNTLIKHMRRAETRRPREAAWTKLTFATLKGPQVWHFLRMARKLEDTNIPNGSRSSWRRSPTALRGLKRGRPSLSHTNSSSFTGLSVPRSSSVKEPRAGAPRSSTGSVATCKPAIRV